MSEVRERNRYEILPFGGGLEEAAQLPEPVRLTVTCSPKHGPDLSVEVAGRMRELGHLVTVHVAARMVRDRAHLDALLQACTASNVDEIFLVAGDSSDPLGDFASGLELLPLIHEHRLRPRAIGVPGYPEGHPLIDTGTLDRALVAKSAMADYVVTQMCFNADVLRSWAAAKRAEGISLPILFGIPGKVNPRKLLELSVRVGVGQSLSYLRKQHGIGHLFGHSPGAKLFDELAPTVGDPELNIAGFHLFTFNQLLETWRMVQAKAAPPGIPNPGLLRDDRAGSGW